MSSEKTQVEETEQTAKSNNVEVEGEALASDETLDNADAVDENESADDDNSLEAELAQAQLTIKEYWDQIMRSRAEMENNRKRAERDVQNAHKYAIKGFTEDLLPVIDSMEMGHQAATAENATLESIREGSELTMNMFVQILQKHGMQASESNG